MGSNPIRRGDSGHHGCNSRVSWDGSLSPRPSITHLPGNLRRSDLDRVRRNEKESVAVCDRRVLELPPSMSPDAVTKALRAELTSWAMQSSHGVPHDACQDFERLSLDCGFWPGGQATSRPDPGLSSGRRCTSAGCCATYIPITRIARGSGPQPDCLFLQVGFISISPRHNHHRSRGAECKPSFRLSTRIQHLKCRIRG